MDIDIIKIQLLSIRIRILDTWKRIQTDKTRFISDRIRIRSENIRTIYIPNFQTLFLAETDRSPGIIVPSLDPLTVTERQKQY